MERTRGKSRLREIFALWTVPSITRRIGSKSLTFFQESKILFSAHAGCFSIGVDDFRIYPWIGWNNDGSSNAIFAICSMRSLLSFKLKSIF